MRRRPNRDRKLSKPRRRKPAAAKRPSRVEATRGVASSAAKQKLQIALLRRELSEARQQQIATADVLRVISSSPGDLEPVFGAMLENAIRIRDATFGNIYRYDGEGLHLVAWHNTPAALVEDRKCSPYRPSSTTPTGRAVAGKATVHVLDAAVEPAYTEERNPGMVAVVELGGMRTYVVVPLLKETEVIGVLTVLRQEVRAFTDKQIELLQNFAAQAVIAIENARLLNELRQLLEHHRRAEAALADSERQLRKAHDELEMNLVEAMKQQTATSEVMRIISNSPIQSVLDAVAENAARLCEANNAEIFRLESNLLRLVASYGEIPVNIHAREGIPANRDRVIGRATCDRRTIQVHNLAAENSEFPAGSEDAKREGHRTTLATPLLREGVPIGVILIRRWEIRPFYAKQIALLENFADQAVIAIENARLFEAEKQRSLALVQANRDLAEREAKIRRLVEANIIGIFIWELDGRIIEANDAFLRMVGYDHEDIVSGRMRWTELTPPEWLDRDERGWLPELKVTGSLQPFEKEYFRKDGSRVPVLIGVATFEEGGNQGVAFVLDLTERKRAEEALRQLESDLAHMNRLSVMGELTASLAHEVTQPIAAARNYARAALNFLDQQPPDLGEVKKQLGSVVSAADRSGEISERIRDHIKKAPPRKTCFDLNHAINEVIVLARTAISRNGVSVQTLLSEGLAAVQGDRVQLQQVVLNLPLNAVEAMGSVETGPRELSISTEQNQTNGALVAVRDSGPGLGPENLERVFEAFYTTKTSGMGMGLSICRSIIDAHGGRLWAGVNEPRGAVFQFTLPDAEKEIMDPRPAALHTRERYEDSASDALHPVACEDNKRLHRSGRVPGQRRSGRQ